MNQTVRVGSRGDAAKEKLAIGLLVTFLVTWIVTIIAIQVVQIHQNGYGSGFGDGGHTPASVRRDLNVPNADQLSVKELMKATNR